MNAADAFARLDDDPARGEARAAPWGVATVFRESDDESDVAGHK
jgi:hypothetical protein